MNNLLALRKRLTIWEASELLDKRNRTAACALMCDAIADGELKPLELFSHGVYVADLGTLVDGGPIDEMQTVLERVEFERWRDSIGMNVEPVSARQVEPVQPSPVDAPTPLTTTDIAYCFDGIRWTEEQWKKPLGDKPKWLQPCIAIPGKRGVHEARWNPVLIGAALVRGGHAKVNSVRARFQTKPQLSPWLEAWKTYEADYFDTE